MSGDNMTKPKTYEVEAGGTFTVHIPMRGRDVWGYHCMDQADSPYLHTSMLNFVMKRLDIVPLMKEFGLPIGVDYELSYDQDNLMSEILEGITISFHWEGTFNLSSKEVKCNKGIPPGEIFRAIDRHHGLFEGLEVIAILDWNRVRNPFCEKIPKCFDEIPRNIFWNNCPISDTYMGSVEKEELTAWEEYAEEWRQDMERNRQEDLERIRWNQNMHQYIREHSTEYSAWLAEQK